MLLELLGALVERAHHLLDEDPATAARCVARVQRDGGGFAIPLGAGDDVDALLDDLADRLGATELSRIVAEVHAQPPWTP